MLGGRVRISDWVRSGQVRVRSRSGAQLIRLRLELNVRRLGLGLIFGSGQVQD